jgi:hypothetical protein
MHINILKVISEERLPAGDQEPKAAERRKIIE